MLQAVYSGSTEDRWRTPYNPYLPLLRSQSPVNRLIRTDKRQRTQSKQTISSGFNRSEPRCRAVLQNDRRTVQRCIAFNGHMETRASRCSRQGISFRFRYRHDRGRPYGESINLSVFVFIPRAPRCARQFPIRLSPPIFQKNRRGGIKHVTESTKLIRLIVQFYCILNRITQESFFVNDSHASACKIT